MVLLQRVPIRIRSDKTVSLGWKAAVAARLNARTDVTNSKVDQGADIIPVFATGSEIQTS